MDLQEKVNEVHAKETQDDVIKAYKEILFQTTNQNIGSTALMLQKNGPFGRSCTFSGHLAKAGNYINNGLNSAVDRDRVNDNSKDWMLLNNN